MPNRIIKDSICTSDNLNNLSSEAEVLFYRLIVNCDDFGRMDARPTIIRAKCYPLKTDVITCNQVSEWLTELSKNLLITVYDINNKTYLYMNTWESHQQKRAKHSKYPDPNGSNPNNSQSLHNPDIPFSNDAEAVSNCNQMISNDSLYEYETENRETNTRNETEKEVISEIFKIFEENYQKITQTITDRLNDLIDEYTGGKVLDALKIAIDKNKRNISYVEGILKNNGKSKSNSKKLPTEYEDFTNV